MTKALMMGLLQDLTDEEEIIFSFLGTESQDNDDAQSDCIVRSYDRKHESTMKGLRPKTFSLRITIETNEGQEE